MHAWLSVAALVASKALAEEMIPLPSCGHWTPQYPVGQHYNTKASISTEKLNVHLIPHTHDDPGWLITVDQYFTQEVDYILDTVVTELAKNPNRRFMYVEQSFFQRWWREQSHGMKHLVKRLVKNGQLDLTANGGWVMHDEATPHYSSMLDQTTFGHKFLLEEFGVRPRIGWQIDPFGHSSTQGSLLSAGIGFDALYFARIDHQDFDKRRDEKHLEFIWKPSPSRNESVFTGMMQSGYGAPDGFFFEDDDPIKDDPWLHDNNVCARVKKFIDVTLERASHQRGNHVFWPMGTDFKYQNALKWFKNLDKLIHYGNQEGRVNFLYSTLGNYTDLKLQDKSIQWAVKTDDFFPYADQVNGFWSGYFTSRPALKRYVRVANNLLQSLRQLEVWAHAPGTQINHLAATVGLSLHHDGITGTEKQAVADDYAQRLGEGVAVGEKRLRELVGGQFDVCLLANISICEQSTTNKSFTFIVYNPLTEANTYSINLPIVSAGANVVQADGTKVPSAVVPYNRVYNHDIAHAVANQLVVLAVVPPLSWLAYHVMPTSENSQSTSWPVVRDAIVIAENNFVRVEIDTNTGSLVTLQNKATNTTIKVKSSLLFYQAYAKDGDSTSSGAYLFHPNTSKVHPLGAVSGHNCVKINDVQSCSFQFGAWGSLTYKLHSWDQNVEVEWTVGPIPIEDAQGKEVIVRFDTSLATEKKWYTDSNGLEFVERIRDYRETWNLTLHNEEEKVAANYVPITIATYLRDTKTQFNVITDRAQGVASLEDGSIEIMVHRRLLADDSKGVGEHLNETETIDLPNNKKVTQGLTVRGTLAITVGPHDQAIYFLRKEMERRQFEPLVAVGPYNKSLEVPLHASFEPRLPVNVGLTSLQVKCSHCVRLRLTHLFAVNEHPELSKDATVDFKLLLGNHWPKLRIKELGLTGNIELGQIEGTTAVLKPMHVHLFEVCDGSHESSPVFDASVSSLVELTSQHDGDEEPAF
ncbi:hypothetical protein AeMF1_003692 [Aphanomyces euteiches]|nr:hypothetical protein AeMF1_003692 [Aphanomyces euteiches]KAH9189308.1 hypothetical protein AeNC1_008720 [Aphanomyces euteiches]